MKREIVIIVFVLLAIALSFLASCSTNSGGDAMIRGTLQHNYGVTIDNRDVVISIDGVNVTTDKLGMFYFRTEPGQYNVTAAYSDTSKGISLNYSANFVLGEKQLLDLTMFLRDTGTADGWASYRQGDYATAASSFMAQVNGPSSNDAYNGLGWASWMMNRDYDESAAYFHHAIKEVRNVEARIGLCGIELSRVPVEGGNAFGRAYQNICLALQEPDGFTTLPRHDSVQEGDMLALKALLGYVSGDVREANFILDNHTDELANEINAHGSDLLTVLSNFQNS